MNRKEQRWWCNRGILSLFGYVIIGIGALALDKVVSVKIVFPVAAGLLFLNTLSGYWYSQRESLIRVAIRVALLVAVLFGISRLLSVSFWSKFYLLLFLMIIAEEIAPFLRSWWEGRKTRKG